MVNTYNITMVTSKNKNEYEFILDTDWLFNGYMDVEHRRYVLLDYFAKMG